MSVDKKEYMAMAAKIQTKYERMDSAFSFVAPLFLTVGVSLLTVYFAMGMSDAWLIGFSACAFSLWALCLAVIHVSIPRQFANEMADLVLKLSMKDRQDPEKDEL